MAVDDDDDGKRTNWRRLIEKSREPGSMFNALLPTVTGGASVVTIVWALAAPPPIAVPLGTCGVALAVFTIRLFIIGGA